MSNERDIVQVRKEEPSDVTAIHKLTAAAFAPMPFSDGSEPVVIDKLRTDGDLTHSLVATLDKAIVGQITFSPVTIAGEHDSWFGLGPVSVHPHLQKLGIGSVLIKKGLDVLKCDGAKGCVLIGNPDYYSRFGFKSHSQLSYGELENRYVQMITLIHPPRYGKILFAKAFEVAKPE